jgi:hypothetical protein
VHEGEPVPDVLRDVGVRERIRRRQDADRGDNLRGTGCSSGEFDLFSWRSALDGREVIDNWIANQTWATATWWTPSRLMLPLVPMSDVRGYAPPSGQCPYASMRCVPG